MRWDNPGMGGNSGGDVLRSGLLRRDEPRMFLGADDAAPGSGVHAEKCPAGRCASCGEPIMFWAHVVCALICVGSFVLLIIRAYGDPCDGREDLEPQCLSPEEGGVRFFWALMLVTKPTFMEMLLLSAYFVMAANCDRQVGREATYLGDAPSPAGSHPERGVREPAPPPAANPCCCCRFLLARVDSQSEKSLSRRDGLFALAWPITTGWVALYWAVLFPCYGWKEEDGCELQKAALRSPLTFVQTVLVNVVCFFMLQVDLLVAHHSSRKILWDLILLVFVIGAYAGASALVREKAGVYPYPSVQRWAHDHGPGRLVLAYGGLAAALIQLALLYRCPSPLRPPPLVVVAQAEPGAAGHAATG